MANFDYLNTELDQIKQNNLFRTLKQIDSAQNPSVKFNNKDYHIFASNNYLNLANDPRIIASAKDALDKFGFGAAASRLVSGTMTPHIQAENALADFTGKESALIFPSGWMANEAIIKTIPQKGDLLLLDKLNHASIIDAAQASDAEFRTYRRDNTERIEKLLDDEKYNRKFIITESIFSMDGDCADLQKLVELKNKYNAYLIVDEAHAFGCLGKNGVGLAEELGLLKEVDIFIATLSKSFAATGGLVAGSKSVIEYLINKARAFIYTTAPSPITASAIITALEIIKYEPERRKRLKDNADYLRKNLNNLGLDTGGSTSHIIPVIIGPEDKTLELAQKLLDAGFYIPAIRPPTVPKGTSRLRISLQCDHTKSQIDCLIKNMPELF